MKALIALSSKRLSEHHNRLNSSDFERESSMENSSKEENKEIHIDISKDGTHEEISHEGYNLKEVLVKAKSFYAASWEEAQFYIKSLTNPSIDDLDVQASTAGDIEDQKHPSSGDLDGKISMKKKLVIYDMVKLGFGSDQIKEAVIFLESLSEEDSTREALLRRAVEYLIEKRNTIDEIMEAEKEPELVFHQQRWGPVPPPREAIKPEPDVYKTRDDDIKPQKRGDRYQEDLEVGSRFQNCPICFTSFPQSELSSLLNCPHSFCKSCYVGYVKEQINTGKVLSINCPKNGCQQKFEDRQIEDLLEQDHTYNEKYNRFKRNAILIQNPNLRWCIRPGCERYMIGKKGTRKLVCECGMKICFRCGNQYHFGRSCESAIDKVYKKYIQEKQVKNCPQCKSKIEKTGGCNHITCTRCTYEWCWLCDEKYDRDHYVPSNPSRCRKLEIEEEREAYQRDTYCSRMIEQPIAILALPLFIIITASLLPQWVFSEYMKKRTHRREYDIAMENSTSFMIFFALLGILLLPITFPLMLLLIITDGLVDFYLWICKKTRGENYYSRPPRMLQPQIL